MKKKINRIIKNNFNTMTISYDGDRATFNLLLPGCSAGSSKASIQCESFDEILKCSFLWIAVSKEEKDN